MAFWLEEIVLVGDEVLFLDRVIWSAGRRHSGNSKSLREVWSVSVEHCDLNLTYYNHRK